MFDVTSYCSWEDFKKLRLGRRSRDAGLLNSPRKYLNEATTPIMAALSEMSFLE